MNFLARVGLSSNYLVLHVITGLEVGGAQNMLAKLLPSLRTGGFGSVVVPLVEGGLIGEALRAQGVPLRPLGMRRSLPDPRGLVALKRIIEQERPHLIQTWMYHADLLGGLAAKLRSRVPVIWGIRRGTLDLRRLKAGTYLAGRFCAATSGWLPAHIICCSEAALEAHAKIGYQRSRMSVIPNGFDTEHFRPDLDAYRSLRAELDLPADALLVGLSGRFDPAKDHQNFVRAAGLVAQRSSALHFVLCGEGMTWDNSALCVWLRATGHAERFSLLGVRSDMPHVSAALDVLVSSSVIEGFPNVVGEAMACAVPCVVTNVGESARIVADTGWVVPPSNPALLAAAINEAVRLPPAERAALGQRARQRIIDRYSLARIGERYCECYRAVLAQPRWARSS
jgi:glycosyltransferase involved in cell wall biosynthesis